MSEKIIETRYYNTDSGIVQVNFYDYGIRIIEPSGQEIFEHILDWVRKYYPVVVEDLKTDSLPTKFSKNGRWYKVR